MIIGYKNILIVTGGKELNCRTKMRVVTREVIKNYRDERLPSIKERKIFRLMTRVVTPELPYTENSFTPLSPVALMGLSTRI